MSVCSVSCGACFIATLPQKPRRQGIRSLILCVPSSSSSPPPSAALSQLIIILCHPIIASLANPSNDRRAEGILFSDFLKEWGFGGRIFKLENAHTKESRFKGRRIILGDFDWLKYPAMNELLPNNGQPMG